MSAKDQGLSREHYLFTPRVLIFIRNRGDVLLLKGSPNKRTWAGLYNGIGGHVEQSETIYQAALREIFEETGLTVQCLTLRGIVAIDASDPTLGILMFIFTAKTDTRQFKPSPEGTPTWFPIDQLPTSQLVEDLPTILPVVLQMEQTSSPPFFARYWYDLQDSLKIELNGQVIK